MKKPQTRSGAAKAESKAVIVYFPKTMLPLIEAAVRLNDTDRSKFIRSAVREKLSTA